MGKTLNKIYLIFVSSFIVLFFAFINLKIHFPSISNRPQVSFLIFWVIIFLILFYVIDRFILKKMSKKSKIVFCCIALLVFLGLELFSYFTFKVNPSWDFGAVFGSANDFVRTASFDVDYFTMYPNNCFLLLIEIIAVVITGGRDIGFYLLNIAVIFLSFLLTILTAKKIGGIDLAVKVAIVGLLITPWYLYTPIVYSDTVGILFPILTIYLWLDLKEGKLSPTKEKILIMEITILSAIAFLIKPLAAIGFVAIIIDTFFNKVIVLNLKKIIKVLKVMSLSLLLFFAVVWMFNFVAYKYLLKTDMPAKNTIPYTHWIMMGLKGQFGGYNWEDKNATLQYNDYSAKKEFNIKEIKSRLSEYGPAGYVNFLANKFEWTWADGTFFVNNKLMRFPIRGNTRLSNYIAFDKDKIYSSVATVIYASLMFIILFCIIYDVFKQKNDVIRVMSLMCFGIALFLLIWEARSRYIYILIPIFCILGSVPLDRLFKGLGITLNKLLKKEKLNKGL